jgi:hypothetical protein
VSFQPSIKVTPARGSQSRPHQKQPSQSKSSALNQSSTISITGNNKFAPNFNTIEYKQAAKEAFNRRMTYDPKKSVSSKTGASAVGGRDYITSNFAYEDKNKLA